MGSRSFTYRFEALDKFSRVSDKITASIEKTIVKADRLAAKADKVGESWQKAGNKMRNIGANLSVVSAGLGLLTRSALKQSASFEQLAISYEVMIGNTELAKETFAELTEFAKKTPFQLGDVARAGKILLAFKVPAEEVADQLRMMGDLASATGKPVSELAAIFGKIKGAGRLMGEHVLQLAERGIGIQAALMEEYSLTEEQAQKAITAGAVKAANVDVLLRRMTAAGSQFGGLAAKQAESLSGLFSTLQGNMDITLAALGDTISESIDLKGVIKGVSDFVEKLAGKIGAFAKEHPTITKYIVLFLGLGIVLGPLILIFGQLVLTVGGMIALAGPVAAGVSAIAGAFTFLATALGVTVGTLILIPLLIGAAIAAVVLLWKNWDTVTAMIGQGIDWVLGKLSFFTDAVSAVTGTIGALFGHFKEGISMAGETISGITGFGDEELAVAATSQTNVDVTLSAPQGVVDAMQTTTTGAPTGNVGASMNERL